MPADSWYRLTFEQAVRSSDYHQERVEREHRSRSLRNSVLLLAILTTSKLDSGDYWGRIMDGRVRSARLVVMPSSRRYLHPCLRNWRLRHFRYPNLRLACSGCRQEAYHGRMVSNDSAYFHSISYLTRGTQGCMLLHHREQQLPNR